MACELNHERSKPMASKSPPCCRRQPRLVVPTFSSWGAIVQVRCEKKFLAVAPGRSSITRPYPFSCCKHAISEGALSPSASLCRTRDENGRHGRTPCAFQSFVLVGRFVMKSLGFCAAGLAEIPKRIDQSAIC